ncbi:MAG: hypothetical protein NTU73_05510, partial [Ignavibacteriae bacterium]|nr:hypothetical protein [Ignavibacteriota bacterium]
MKKIIFLTAIIISIINIALAQNQYDITEINTSANPISYVLDISFVDYNTGYLTAEYYIYSGGNYTGDKNYVFKTTNGGINWLKIWENTYGINSKNLSVSFANATTGYISKQNALYKTTNGGTNFTSISNSLLSGYDNVICTKSNGDVYIIQDHSYKVYKYSSSQGFQTIKDFSSTYAILYMEFSKLNDNTIYVCGEKYSSPYNPFLAKSNDGGTTWVTILDGSVNTNDAGYIDNMSVTNNGSYDIVKLSARYKLIEYNSNTGNTNDLTSDWSAGNRISFGDQNNGYFLNYDGGQDEPPSESGTTGVYRTTNGGVNWTVEVGNPGAGYFFNTVIKFYSRGQMTYFTRSGGNIANFYNRKLNTNLNTFYDNISVSGTISMNNNPFNTPYSGFIRGGAYTFSSSQIINSGQSDERILYKWSNNINSHGTYQYPLYYEDIFSSYYKTKFISNIQNAISNGSLPKSFRDTNNVINQVHESMGGVFYSRSTDNGTSFSREEIVNYLDKNKENKNAFISEIKQGNSTFEPYSEGNIIAIYQYREGNNEIFKCLYKNIVPPNYKQWEELSVLNFSFTSQNPFNAKARIFAQQGTSNIPNNQNDLLTITTYLYPNGNTVELKVKVGGGYPYQQEFTIDEGNIVTDYSVTRSTQGQYQVLY